MKKVLYILGLSLLTLSSIAQTKQETIDWLNKKLETSGFCPEDDSDPDDPYKYGVELVFTKINNDGSYTVTLQKKFGSSWMAKTEPDVIVEFYGHFKNLAPNTLRSNVHANSIGISMECTSGDCISYKVIKGKVYGEYVKSDIWLACLNSKHPEEADRVIKALKHLTSLCGGKNQPF